MNPGITTILKNPASFLTSSGSDGVAISSRIRLSRNLAGVPFPAAATVESAATVLEEVRYAVLHSPMLNSPKPLFFEISQLDEIEKQLLSERRLVSRELLESKIPSAVAVSSDESCAVMINEEDQIRMQCLQPGFELKQCWQSISRLDDELGKDLEYAWEENLGYLTSCPTNVGTGMRASVMLHLPGLVMTDQIGATVHGIGKLGLAVRGICGEGSDNLGSLYQISNQATLGECEENIVEQLSAVIRQVIEYERKARKNLLVHDRFTLLDHVGRSFGILQNSYKLSVSEALESLSGIRLGVELGLFKHIKTDTVNELFMELNPGHLQLRSALALPESELDLLRAKLFRSKLREKA